MFVWIACDERDRMAVAPFLGHCHDLGVGGGDVSTRTARSLAAKHSGAHRGVDGQWRVDITRGTDCLDQTVYECVGATIVGSHLCEDRNWDQKRAVEA